MSLRNTAALYQRVIEEILETMGRNDVAIEHVSVASEGVLSAAFVRGLRRKRITLSLERLVDRTQVRAAIEGALADLAPRGPESGAPFTAGPEARSQERGRQPRRGAHFD